jgi:hypothetical protein
MVNALSPVRRTSLRCREIGEADLGGIIDLLRRGFPGRRASYWTQGFARMAALDVPVGYPRFGFMMESADVPVGVILTMYHRSSDAPDLVRCNLSSWYVAPDFRSYASLLISVVLRHREVIYINISPAPQTWPTVEAQGFVRYVAGQYVAFPLLKPSGVGLAAEKFSSEASYAGLSANERQILADHAIFGALSLVCRRDDGDLPFVFTGFSIRAGRVRLPCVRLIYCRDIKDFSACAGAISRFLLRRGVVAVLCDANGTVPGLPGFYTERLGRKYFKGTKVPRLGDLAYSELAVFGS